MKKFVSLAALTLAFTGCTSNTPITPKTIDNIAVELCQDFFSKQEKTAKLSLTDITDQLCKTAEQLQPFLDSARAAEAGAGARRMQATP
jgi:hypothetical protein